MNDNSSLLQKQNLETLLLSIYLPLHKKVPLFGPKKKVIVLAGPTGTGKTELSLHLASLLGGEIISADSMQVYKNMDIGTAKVSKEVRQKIPHHLIDVVDVHEPFNVATYFSLVEKTLQEIVARGNVPIIVGGSGFYLEAILYGPPLGPKSDPVVRKSLENKMEELGCAAMYEQLQLLDPEYAKNITENDRHKIIRALEIMTISEKKVSDFKRPLVIKNDKYDFRLWFLYYPLETLYHRIEKRCLDMIKEGLIEEVHRLKEEGLAKNAIAAKAIGYKQVLEFLDTDRTSEDYDWLIYTFKQVSRHYAKRQMTWFRRKHPPFRWINFEKHSKAKVIEWILQDYEQAM